MSENWTNTTNETLLPEGVRVENTTLIKDSVDSTRMSVRFLISADLPDEAFAFAQHPQLIEEGLRIVRKEGLFSPGVNSTSVIPIACDENGVPLANPMGTIDPNEKQRYFYSVTYSYLGED